jgi:hypothetical protein
MQLMHDLAEPNHTYSLLDRPDRSFLFKGLDGAKGVKHAPHAVTQKECCTAG